LSDNESSSAATEEIVPTHDFVAYDRQWVGRNALVQEISEEIQNGRRLILLTGMAGIGKTALAERVVLKLTTWLPLDRYPVSRLNFDHQAHGTDFITIAMKWLADWGEAVAPEEQRSPALLLQRIWQSMSKQRRLIIIDALEKALTSGNQTGESRSTDEWWTQFFRGVLAAEALQGRVVVTTQELPIQLAAFGAEYPNRWLRIALHGLDESEQMTLFQQHGLYTLVDSSASAYLSRIGSLYAGHPLALRTIAGEIREDYGGNVLAYWQEFGHEIEIVEHDLATAREGEERQSANDNWRLDRFSIELQRQVQHRLHGTFERLQQHAPDAYVMICAATAHRTPRPARFWLGLLGAFEKSLTQQQTAFQALRDRDLLEEVTDPKGNKLFALHNLIRSIALEHRRQLWPTP